jgi:hypothetical protein
VNVSFHVAPGAIRVSLPTFVAFQNGTSAPLASTSTRPSSRESWPTSPPDASSAVTVTTIRRSGSPAGTGWPAPVFVSATVTSVPFAVTSSFRARSRSWPSLPNRPWCGTPLRFGDPVAISAISPGMWQVWHGLSALGPAFQSAYSVNTGTPLGSHQWQAPQISPCA